MRLHFDLGSYEDVSTYARIRPTMGIKFSVTDAQRGTRFMLIAGQPYGEIPIFNGSYVD